jgi:hypothetical protein
MNPFLACNHRREHADSPDRSFILGGHGRSHGSGRLGNRFHQQPIVRCLICHRLLEFSRAVADGALTRGEPAVRELIHSEIAAVSGGVPEPLRYDAVAFEAPEAESANDYFNELLSLSRGLRADLNFV